MFRYQRFVFKHNMYKLREERNIKPSTFGQLVSSTLYEKRYGDITVTTDKHFHRIFHTQALPCMQIWALLLLPSHSWP